MSRSSRAFTLIELLVVVGIVAVIAAILFPVLAHVRERGRRTQCLSNERQLGMAILQYASDNSETLFVGGAYAQGIGWAGKCYPYVKSTQVYRCADDATADVPAGGAGSMNGQAMCAVSYGFNSNLAGKQVPALPGFRPIPSVGLAEIAAPARTVMLFEAGGNVAALTEAGADDQSAYGNTVQGSAVGGSGGVPASDYTFPIGYSTNSSGLVLYATGNMGGKLLNGATKGGIALPGEKGSEPRHGDGANYAACDGHVVWLRPEQVSPGFSAEAADLHIQPASNIAAEAADPRYALTFSSK